MSTDVTPDLKNLDLEVKPLTPGEEQRRLERKIKEMWGTKAKGKAFKKFRNKVIKSINQAKANLKLA